MSVRVEHGDSRDVIRTLPDCSIESCVTDPPYALVSIQKRFGKPGSAAAKDRDGLYRRASAGFMGQQWDTGETAFDPAFWVEVLRVLKPGAHLLAFSGTRSYHRLACAIEDAGFEIRDQLMWLYGTGFPKSHDVSKAIDKAAGAERATIATEKVRDIRNGHGRGQGDGIHAAMRDGPEYIERALTAPATDAAQQWEGWGTALKPAHEPIVMARKPLIGTVAANVLAHGTGAINIDACRVGTDEDTARLNNGTALGRMNDDGWQPKGMTTAGHAAGRWPANVVHDGSDEVLAAFAEFGESKSPTGLITQGGDHFSIGSDKKTRGTKFQGHGDSGTAARFFYSAKAGKKDRAGSKHPTVKPVSLMRWLVRLVTPPGGLVLDPFAGSGTTGQAASEEGFDAILIEREAEYVVDIKRRIAALDGSDTPLFAAPQTDIEGVA